MPLAGEELRQLAVQRVTQGVPALSPAERAAVDYKKAQKRKQDEAVQDFRRKQELCIGDDGKTPTTNLEAALGKPLSLDQFSKKLKQVNARLIVERSKNYPKLAGIYIRDGVSNLDDPNEQYRGVRYLGISLESGFAPEFTVRHAKLESYYDAETETIKQRQVPTGELTIGWRVPLARLIRLGFITPFQCDKVFGLPSRDSKNWWLLTT